MKKTLLLVIGIACAMAMHARVIYLNTGGSSLWNPSESEFFCQSWSDNSAKQEILLTKVNELVFKAEIDDAHTRIIFVRMPKGSASIAENATLNKTAVLSLTPDLDLYTITGLGENDGAWSQIDETSKKELNSNIQLEYRPEKEDPKTAW